MLLFKFIQKLLYNKKFTVNSTSLPSHFGIICGLLKRQFVFIHVFQRTLLTL